MSLEAVFALVLSMVGRPIETNEELQRYARIAVASDIAAEEQIARGWNGTKAQLVRAELAAVDFESGKGARSVHSGDNTRNGWCLTQIHRTNGHWKKVVTNPSELLGTGLGPTTNCMRVAARTLAGGLSWARRNGYRRHKWRAMWTVYVLRSGKNGQFYTGMTCDLSRRLREHNRGYNASTRGRGPFSVVHTEQFDTRPDARRCEKFLKSGAGREWLKSHICAE